MFISMVITHTYTCNKIICLYIQLNFNCCPYSTQLMNTCWKKLHFFWHTEHLKITVVKWGNYWHKTNCPVTKCIMTVQADSIEIYMEHRILKQNSSVWQSVTNKQTCVLLNWQFLLQKHNVLENVSISVIRWKVENLLSYTH